MSCFEKFIPYCLSLVLYVHYSFSMIQYSLGRQVAESPKPRPFKPDRPRSFANSLCRLKKNTFTHCASGSQFTCAPYNIYFQGRSAYSAAGDMWTDPGIYKNRSQTHECGWDWGCTVSQKQYMIGIFIAVYRQHTCGILCKNTTSFCHKSLKIR